MAKPDDEGKGAGAAVKADEKKHCHVCGAVVERPYKVLLGGDVVCSMECYQTHLGEPDEGAQSDLYWSA
jgi:hypothetical protein